MEKKVNIRKYLKRKTYGDISDEIGIFDVIAIWSVLITAIFMLWMIVEEYGWIW